MKIYRLSPLAVAVVLAACGGSSSSPTVAPTTSSGLAVDGYISGATVVCDANANGVADTGETTTTTDSVGAYSLVCSSPLLLTGGTNIDTNLPFKGVLRAPEGSSVITPLTNLIALGMTRDQVRAVLGLPSGTDVTGLDPAAKVNGLLVNEALYQRTLAVQQLIQQTADVIFAAAQSGTATEAETRAQYAVIAKAVASELIEASSSATLISSSGAVSSSLVTTLIEASVTAIKDTTDTTLTALKTAAASLHAPRLADFLQPSLTDQATNLATASQTALEVLAEQNGTSNILATVAASLRTASAFEADSTVTMTSVATAAQSAVTNGVITSSTVAALSSAGVTTPPTVTVVTNYFAIADNEITLGNTTQNDYTLAELAAGITLAGPASSTDDLFNLSFTLITDGTPITSVTTGLGFELAGTGEDKRVLRFVIDKVDLTLASGQVTASVPADAKLSVYARKSDESEVTLQLTNLAANTLSTSAGSVTFNASAVVTKILAEANSSTESSFFSTFLNSTGTFALKAVLSNTVPIRAVDKSLLSIKTVTVGSVVTPATVSGPSVAGTVTVTPAVSSSSMAN